MSKHSHDPAYQAFRILQVGFIIVLLFAGFDKFFYLFTDWSMYLSPMALQLMQGNDRGFMMGVGVWEMVLGLGVIFKPKIFAYIISAWLLCIIVNVLLTGQYFDIVLRDTALLLAAVSLARLSHKYGSRKRYAMS